MLVALEVVVVVAAALISVVVVVVARDIFDSAADVKSVEEVVVGVGRVDVENSSDETDEAEADEADEVDDQGAVKGDLLSSHCVCSMLSSAFTSANCVR